MAGWNKCSRTNKEYGDPINVIPDLIRDLHTLVLTSVGINARRSRALFRLKLRTLHIFSPRQRDSSLQLTLFALFRMAGFFRV